MAPTLFNQSADIIENYKGHIEILETTGGDVWFNPDELLDWSVFTIADTEKHYSTTGQKRKTILAFIQASRGRSQTPLDRN